MQILLILRGLPGSGKSTYASNLLKTSKNWKRINKDMLREMLDDKDPTKESEEMLNHDAKSLIISYLTNGFNVVSDNMNMNPLVLESLLLEIKWLKSHGILNIDVQVMDFDVDIYTCIERDSKRPKPVTSKAIMKVYNTFMPNGKFPDISLLL